MPFTDQVFINGKWVKPKSGRYFDTINPTNEQKLARIAEAGEADVDAAVKAARKAYDTVWSRMPAAERATHIKDPSHNGRSLRENPLPPPEGHSYRSPVDGYCIAYGRDRGETGTEARRGAVPADVCGREEYNYLWNGETWSVNGTALAEVLAESEKD